MADLLASLEVGITRTVGATQRLRSQITRMDEYMIAQRQQDQPQPLNSVPYTSVSGESSTTLPVPIDSINPRIGAMEIDPLQETHWQSEPSDAYQYIGDGVGGDEFLFQLPPELLEGWPWISDIPMGFGSFDQ